MTLFPKKAVHPWQMLENILSLQFACLYPVSIFCFPLFSVFSYKNINIHRKTLYNYDKFQHNQDMLNLLQIIFS